MAAREEHFYREILDAIVQPVVVADGSRTILYANEAATRVHGWSESDTLDMPDSEILPTLTAEELTDFESRLRGGQPWSGQLMLRDSTAEAFPALLTVSPVTDATTGDITHFVAVSADLTNHLALQRRFQRGFESAPHGWAFTDLEGRITEANDAFCEIIGRDRNRIVGRTPSELMFPEDANRQTPFEAIRRGAAPDQFETRKRYRRPDGTTRWVNLHVELVRDHLGHPEYFFGTVQDITRLFEAAEAAERAESAYHRLFHDVVASIGAALELRDAYTAGHQQRVGGLCSAIGARMGLDPSACEGLSVGGSLHDIGKVATPAEILTKPGALDGAEHAIVQRHARAGHDIVCDIDFPWPVATMILQHHERLDGSGYPDGLGGDEISVEARILGVADTVDTIVSHRPYRPARPLGDALRVLREERGALFDVDVVDACLDLFSSGFTLPAPPLAVAG